VAEHPGAPGQAGHSTSAGTAAATRARPDDVTAFRELLDRWFDSCVDVAWQVLHDADAAAEVAQDTFFAAWHAHTARKPPAEAGAWVLRASRDGALGRLAQARHQAPGSEPWPSSGAPTVRGGPDRDAGADLLRAASAALGEADASVLDLHLRHGFGVPELAQALGAPRNDTQELVLRLNRRLGRALRAWSLWPDGRPGPTSGCDELRRALATNGVTTFGPAAVTEIARHAKLCERCQDRQRLAASPEALYAAVPVVPAGTMLATATARALADRGVPLDVGPAPDGAPAGPGRAAATSTSTSTATSTSTGPASPEAALPLPGPPASREAWPGVSPAPGGVDGKTASSPPGNPAGPPAAAGPPTAAGPSAGGAITPTAAVSAPPPPPPGGEATWASPTATSSRTPGDAPAAHLAGAHASGSGDGSPSTARGLVLVVAAVVAVLALGAGAALALGGGGDDDGAATTTTASPDTSAAMTTTGPPTGPTTTSATGPTTTAPGTPTTAGLPAMTIEPTTSTTAAGTATGEPPTVVDFGVASVSLGRPCASTDRRITLQWQVTGADSVILSGEGAPAGPLPATGQAIACRVTGPPVPYTLTATGPGGTQAATVSA
jgi:DNA-directed RNA polymerase specialized sigma24 family protein